MLLPIHHIVLGVADLDASIKDFENLGFVVTPGGIHKGGISHNALIHFSDGSFLELFAFRKNLKVNFIRLADRLGLLKKWKQKEEHAHMPRFMKGFHGEEGIMDYAVLVKDIEKYKAQIGVEEIGPSRLFSRKRPDGIVLSWKLAFPKDLHLPFLMSPYVPELEIDSLLYSHPNGAKGISQIDIKLENWDTYFQLYQAFFQIAPQIGRELKEPKASYAAKGQQIVLKSGPESLMGGISSIYLKGEIEQEINCRNIHILIRK
ncbi:MAG: VOC family protein [Bacteroidota bacterium]